MFLASDNIGPVPDEIFQALANANLGYQSSYGKDDITKDARTLIRGLFQAPEAAVYIVGTGTAANALALSTLANPWDTIFCTPVAHLHEDECNAPEFFSGGCKLTLVEGHDKITPDALHKAIQSQERRGVHGPQRGPVSITQLTEKGTVYSLQELKTVVGTAKSYDLAVHMDGARFANAMVSLGCSAAEMSWKLGIDAVSFGCSKNGLMSAEAVVFFDPKHAWEFELRRKRSGHLQSKHRYLSAQIKGYLENDLWLDLARKANDHATYLFTGLKQIEHCQFVYQPDGNMIFVKFPRGMHQIAIKAGAYYDLRGQDLENGPKDELLTARMVCDWSIGKDNIDQFLAILKAG
ncbi:beta-eliminating lyase-related protein [Paracoccaceae bacterium]|nr:beta-eliminating lyase-related protein [Paracoccaceae bacterium]